MEFFLDTFREGVPEVDNRLIEDDLLALLRGVDDRSSVSFHMVSNSPNFLLRSVISALRVGDWERVVDVRLGGEALLVGEGGIS